jgi:hypothetical protein
VVERYGLQENRILLRKNLKLKDNLEEDSNSWELRKLEAELDMISLGLSYHLLIAP